MPEAILNIKQIRQYELNGELIRVEFLLEKVSSEEKEQKILWYQFEKKFEPYLCIDRCDSAVVSLFLAAMKFGYTAITSEIPISKKLFYNLSYHVIPQIYATDKFALSRLRLDIPIIDSCYQGESVASGMSRGVDSFATLYEYGKRCKISDYRINLLTYFQVGAHHGYDATMGQSKESRQELFENQLEKTRKWCTEQGYPLLAVESNVSEVLEQSKLFIEWSFDRTHTFRNLGVAILFQKGICRYYYSSAYNLTDFHIKIETDIAHFEKWFIPLLSSGSIEFYSSNQEWTRMEKVEKISQMEECYNSLQVCLVKTGNCGGCMKCKRTLLELDALGDETLRKFGKSFDIETYKRKNRIDWYRSLAEEKEKKNMSEAHYYDEVFLCAVDNHPELLANIIERVETGIRSVVIDYDLINVRKLPSMNAQIIDVVKKGDMLPYIGNYGSWVVVELGMGQRGYLIKKGVSLSKRKPKMTLKEESGVCKVQRNFAILRELPNPNSKVIGFGYKEESLCLQRNLGYWIEIKLKDGRRGYVVKDAVEVYEN